MNNVNFKESASVNSTVMDFNEGDFIIINYDSKEHICYITGSGKDKKLISLTDSNHVWSRTSHLSIPARRFAGTITVSEFK